MASSKKRIVPSSDDLDDTICQQMRSLVELLVTSGKPVLIPEVMKKFKRLCRTSDAYVRYAYDLLMMELVRDHSEIRLTAFQMVDELFNRSHAFRERVLEDFQTLLELTLDCDHNCPLPPPKQAATRLKDEALKCIQQWNDKFGEAYKKLVLGYQYLKSCKKVDFDAVSAKIATEQRQREETARKLEEARLMKLEQVRNDVKDTSPDIELCLKEIENCIQLLLPHPDMFFISESDTPELATEPVNKSLNGASKCSDSRTRLKTNGAFSDVSSVNSGLLSMDQEKSDYCFSSQDRTDGDVEKEKTEQNLEISENINDGSVDKSKNACVSLKGSESSEQVTKHKISSSDCDNIERKNDIAINESTEINEPLGTNQFHGTETVEGESSDGDSDEDDSDFEGVDEQARLTQTFGLGSRNYQISVTIGGEDRLKETEDNKDIIQTLKDQYRLVKTKYLAVIKKWLQTLESNQAEKEELTAANDMKSKLEDALKKCVELEILGTTDNKKKEESDSDEDEDFEEVVDKEGYEEDVPEHMILKEALEKPSTSKQSGSKTKGKSSKRVSESKSKNMSSKRLKVIAEKAIASQKGNILNKSASETSQDSSNVQHKASVKKTATSAKTSSVSSTWEQTTSPKKSVSAISSGSTGSQQKTSLKKSASVTSPGSKGMTTPSYWSLNCRLEEEDIKDPTSWKSNVAKLMEKVSGTSVTPDVTIKQEPGTELLESSKPAKIDLHEKAPVVPFGIDLEHWENPDKIEAPLEVKYEGARRFWGTNEEAEKDPTQKVAALAMRSMSFTGEFEPVKWKCRAPLPSGKLCERMDREKCPFHGKIIGRDETGQPSDPADIARLIKTEPDDNTEHGDSADSDHNLDLDLVGSSKLQKKSTGKGKCKGKGKGKGKGKSSKWGFPGLTDTTQATNHSRQRLEAKIFNKSAMKRVNTDLDRADFKRVRDKFGNQFNYSLR